MTLIMQPATPRVQPLPETREAGYWDVLSYVVSTAVAGEVMAVDNYRDLARMLGDGPGGAEAVEQADEEARHVHTLTNLGRNLGFPVVADVITPEWQVIRRNFQEADRRGDVAACLIMQDLMIEAMAVLLYSSLADEVETDERTALVARALLSDELGHLDIGVRRIHALMELDAPAVHESLVWAHHHTMPHLFDMIGVECLPLRAALGLEGTTLELSQLQCDVQTLQTRALDVYLGMLDMVGFDDAVTNELLAHLASLELRDPARRA